MYKVRRRISAFRNRYELVEFELSLTPYARFKPKPQPKVRHVLATYSKDYTSNVSSEEAVKIMYQTIAYYANGPKRSPDSKERTLGKVALGLGKQTSFYG